MGKRKSSLFKVTKPKVRITSKGVRVTKPRARIGGKSGVNISSKGVSFSTRTKVGTVSSRKGRSTGLLALLDGCGVLIVLVILAIVIVLVAIL
jgi:hypothetical protein